MERDELARRVSAACLLSGTFRLRSGQTSDAYFDKYLFEADPVLLREVADHARSLLPTGTEVVAGLELGGIPVAVALSLLTGIPTAFVRKAAKTYGTARVAEGASVANRQVVIVEDVITTGGQVVASADDLRGLGAAVTDVVCVIDRSNGDQRLLADAGLAVHSLFTSADLRSSQPHPD